MKDFTIHEKEIKDRVFNLYLDNLHKSLDVINRMIPTVWKFDGKVYNARFENTLRDQLDCGRDNKDRCNIHVDLDNSHLRITLNFYGNRSVSENYCNYYLPSGFETIWIGHDNSDWSYDLKKNIENGFFNSGLNTKNYFYLDANRNIRIKSARIVDCLLERYKEIEKEIQELEEEKKKVEENYREVEELKEKLSKLNDSIPYVVRRVYDIKSYGSYL